MKQTVFLSQQARPELRAYLESMDLRITEVGSHGIVGEAVACHPDIFCCRLGIGPAAPVVTAPELNVAPAAFPQPASGCDPASYSQTDSASHSKTDPNGFPRLGPVYPQDCLYNAACTGKYFLHKLAITAPALRKMAEERWMALIDVPQGYTKCSVVVVDETSLITADEGIARACAAFPELRVLKIRPGHVGLPGFSYGFLGGASGRIGDEVIFHGDLSAHPDQAAIRAFITARGLRVRDFPAFPLTDIGSIL